MQLKMLKSNGQAREITIVTNDGLNKPQVTRDGYIPSEIRTIMSDNNIELDIDKLYYTSIVTPKIPHKANPWGDTDKMTLVGAESQLINRLLDYYKVDNRYLGCHLDTFNPKGNEQVFEKIKEYHKSSSPYQSVILTSRNWGVGKTHILYALGLGWYNNPFVVINFKNNNVKITYDGLVYKVIREEDLMLSIRGTYSKDSTKSECDLYNELENVDILAIDDVGKYTPSNMDFYRRVMFQIIDSRYNHEKSVVISTNLTLDELASFLGGAVADRLNEMSSGFQLEIKGQSYRGLKNG